MTNYLKHLIKKKFKKNKDVAQQFDRQWTTNLVQTLFNRRIAETKLPSRFTALKFDLYDRTTDLIEHLIVYRHVIFPISLPHEKREIVIYKILSTSLKGATLTWFDSIEPESINSFEELVNQCTICL